MDAGQDVDDRSVGILEIRPVGMKDSFFQMSGDLIRGKVKGNEFHACRVNRIWDWLKKINK